MSVYQDGAHESDRELAPAQGDEKALIDPERRRRIVNLLERQAYIQLSEGGERAHFIVFKPEWLARALGEPVSRSLLADLAALAGEGFLSCPNARGERGQWTYVSDEVGDMVMNRINASLFDPEQARRAALRKEARNKRHEITARDGERCQHCGATEKLAVDHIIPISKGGESNIENLQLLCKPCNTRKKDHI